jgi:hypothetical protein
MPQIKNAQRKTPLSRDLRFAGQRQNKAAVTCRELLIPIH